VLAALALPAEQGDKVELAPLSLVLFLVAEGGLAVVAFMAAAAAAAADMRLVRGIHPLRVRQLPTQ
jgi:hypothetical protein